MSNKQEKSDLLILAHDFIEMITKQLYLFEDPHSGNIVYVNQIEFIGIFYSFLYELVSKLIIKLGFDKLKNSFLIDLVKLRMITPASKLHSIELLAEYFGINQKKAKLL